jgi:DNA-binding transcriptional ArsR family regulator
VLGHIACMMETLKALAEPNRLQIVELLLEGPRPVGELVDELVCANHKSPNICEC